MRTYTVVAATFIAIAVSATALAGAGIDVTTLPGYVDFDTDAILGDLDAEVEISLSTPMLRFIAGVTNVADANLGATLSALDHVRIKVFSLESAKPQKGHPDISDLIKWLEKNGWDRIVHVKEDTEAVNIYIRLNEDKIAGLALVVGDSREFVFINIVGNMDPAQMGSLIGRLAGEQMGPELLSRIDESIVDGGGVADD